MTIDLSKPLAPRKGTNLIYILVNRFLDYIKEHLRPHASFTMPIHITPGTFCPHSTPGDCLQSAKFYRPLSKGGNAYLNDKDVFVAIGQLLTLSPDHKDTIRDVLKLLNLLVGDIVGPLFKSALNYEKRDQLAYLTNVNMNEEVMPWGQDSMVSRGDAESEDEEMED